MENVNIPKNKSPEIEKVFDQQRDLVLQKLVKEIEENILTKEEVKGDQKLFDILSELISATREKLEIRSRIADHDKETVQDIEKEAQTNIIKLSSILQKEYPNVFKQIQVQNFILKQEN